MIKNFLEIKNVDFTIGGTASEDLLEAAAAPSLFLILIATAFIMLTSKYILREKWVKIF